ncbi:hypothetical protein QVD17_26188 [Tagetes erecta]|uniref:Uncharacterized protein n=1 Tax=Tagetes erecta TaxID=13708 RepID=A0AAD8K8X0_TARER|nr:hypothetical protein QVD17_26188 [Tagetes erecta]
MIKIKKIEKTREARPVVVVAAFSFFVFFFFFFSLHYSLSRLSSSSFRRRQHSFPYLSRSSIITIANPIHNLVFG